MSITLDKRMSVPRKHRQVYCAHHIVEDEAAVGELEVFKEAVEFPAVQRAPGAVQVVSRLRLLPRVIVVQELVRKQKQRSSCEHDT